MPAFQDLSGQRFHQLLVLRRAPERSSSKKVQWICLCDCGKETPVIAQHLTNGNTQSCGCLKHKRTVEGEAIDWDDPKSANVRRRELYANKRAKGHKRVRTAAYYARKSERKKERRQEDPALFAEKVRHHAKLYRQRHPEKVAHHNVQFRIKNPGYSEAYRLAHPEGNQQAYQRRKTRLLQATINDFTPEQWKEMQEVYGYRCVYCHRKMKRLTMDHIIPLSKGGNHTASNIVPACKRCNSRKQAGPVLGPVQPMLLLTSPSRPIAK